MFDESKTDEKLKRIGFAGSMLLVSAIVFGLIRQTGTGTSVSSSLVSRMLGNLE